MVEVPLNSNDAVKTSGTCSNSTDMLNVMWTDKLTSVSLSMEFTKSKDSNFSLSAVRASYSIKTGKTGEHTISNVKNLLHRYH